ncbi:MAG: CsbD family protein [Sphingomonadales bacterium]|nr:CsbD family protein [Sphingomonadales bacterium]
MGELVDRAKGLTNEAIGNTKQALGKAADNEELLAKGIKQERKGEAQQAIGKVKGAMGDKV